MFNLGGIRGGVIVVRDFVRDLPMNKIAERTIGYEKRNPNGTYIKVGLEGAYGKHLRGKPGKQLRQRIANNQWKPLSNNYQQQPIDGLDIWTTISTDIQDITHNSLLDALEKFDADHGSAVVMETKTGKIKAISNLGKTSDNKYYEKLNYAIGHSYEPGSTFKLFSMLVALEDKVIDTSSVIDTEMGELKFFNKYLVRDSKKGGYGKIPISEVFERSSNTGVVKMIYEKYKENPEKFSDRLISIGIDKPLGLSIKGEGKPKIPHPDDNDWDGLDLPWMSFGYGVQLTPIQTLAYYNAIANNGELVMPRFVSSIRKFDGTLFKKFDRKIINPAICSEDTVKKLKIMMQGVVSKPWGTAHNIFDKNIILAGKTGTTQINYATDRVEYVSSFVGYFPANNPKYSCIVVISKPNKAIGYYGNKVAAPVFKKIAKSVINNLPNELKLNIDDINRLSDLMNQPSDNTKVLDKS
jgi:cell division protein FtsI (penicillin-binding protein 3)